MNLDLSISQALALTAMILVVIVLFVLALKIISRVATTIIKIGCLLLTMLLLLVGSYLMWLMLTGPR